MAAIAPQNVTLEPLRPHMELIDPATGDVWLCQSPLSFEEFKALRVAPPLMKSGCTSASFSAAHFLRSPGAAADGPLESRVVDGRPFVRVARALSFAGKNPMRVSVDKHHVMTFGKERDVTVARLPDAAQGRASAAGAGSAGAAGGLYVQQTESIPDKSFAAPEGWRLHRARLTQDWIVHVPAPASVFFFSSLASFIGPLPIESLPAAVRREVDTV